MTGKELKKLTKESKATFEMKMWEMFVKNIAETMALGLDRVDYNFNQRAEYQQKTRFEYMVDSLTGEVRKSVEKKVMEGEQYKKIVDDISGKMNRDMENLTIKTLFGESNAITETLIDRYTFRVLNGGNFAKWFDARVEKSIADMMPFKLKEMEKKFNVLFGFMIVLISYLLYSLFF